MNKPSFKLLAIGIVGLLVGTSRPAHAEASDAIVQNLEVRGTMTARLPDDHFIKLAPAGLNTNSGTFNFSSQSTPNQFGETRPNVVFRMDYNMTPGGGMENQADGSFGYEFETHYAPSATERFFEHHLSYFSPTTGANYRPWSWAFFKNSTTPALVDRIEHSIAVDKLSFLNRDYKNQYLIFQPNAETGGAGGEITMVGPTAFVATQNNYSPFIQLDSQGASRSLVYLDDNNHVRLGASGDPVSLSENLYWEQDSQFDIGQRYNYRPRDLFVGRDARIGGSVMVSGKVGIGVNDPLFRLHVNGSVAGVGPYRNLSDERLKTNVVKVTDALDKVLALRGVRFEWKTNLVGWEGLEEGTHFGFLAQEVQRVLPEVVAEDRRGTLNVAYGDILPVVVEAVKEQAVTAKASNEAKDREIAELRKRVESLEKLLQSVIERTR